MDVNVIFIDKWWSVHCCSFWKEITYALFDCIKLEARVTFASSLALAKFWKSFSRLYKRKLEMMLQGQKVKGKIGSNQDALEPLLNAWPVSLLGTLEGLGYTSIDCSLLKAFMTMQMFIDHEFLSFDLHNLTIYLSSSYVTFFSFYLQRPLQHRSSTLQTTHRFCNLISLAWRLSCKKWLSLPGG